MGGPSGNSEKGYSIAVDSSGVYTTGYFTDTADFDPGTGVVNLTALGAIGIYDIYISKLDLNGNYLWVKQIGSTGGDHARGIKVDSSGIYTTGYFSGTVDFDPGTNTSSFLTSAGSGDLFVSKLDLSGNYIWAKGMGGTGDDRGYFITTDSNGVYSTGYFNGTADFDPGADSYNLTSAGSTDIYISKLDSSTGVFVWAKQMGGTGADYGRSARVDSSGSVYTAGYFTGTADFDPGAGTVNFTSSGVNDIFVSKLTPLDTIPNNFTFTAQTFKSLSTQYESNEITISGINTSSPISISSCTGTVCEYSINGGAYIASAGTVVNGDTVKVHQTSSGIELNTTDLVLNIGGVMDTFSVTTGDFTIPNITLLGFTTVEIYRGSLYIDAGATATDNIDVDITSNIITVNNVDTSNTGTYTVTYNVSDLSGNSAQEVTRTVIVKNKQVSSGSLPSGSSIQIFITKTPIITINTCLPGELYNTSTGVKCSTSQINTSATNQSVLSLARTLKLNMKGEDVKTLQLYLNIHGYTVAQTGAGSVGKETIKFGLLTKKAVIKFQLANNLIGDGIVGPMTRGKMK